MGKTTIVVVKAAMLGHKLNRDANGFRPARAHLRCLGFRTPCEHRFAFTWAGPGLICLRGSAGSPGAL